MPCFSLAEEYANEEPDQKRCATYDSTDFEMHYFLLAFVPFFRTLDNRYFTNENI